MKQAIKASLLLLVLFLSLSVYIVMISARDPKAEMKLALCRDDCWETFGPESANRGLQALSAGVLKDCGGMTTKQYAEFASCKDTAMSEFKQSEEECKIYLELPSYGTTPKQNYDQCINEAKNMQKFKEQICVEIYLDACKWVCMDKCEGEKEEPQGLACIDSTCRLVEKGTAPAGAIKVSCSGRKEGDHCGDYIVCKGNMCKASRRSVGKELCAGKGVGDSCCEPPYYGKVFLAQIIKREVEVVESEWTTLTRKWNYYVWQELIPYDKTSCTYNRKNAREVRLFVKSGISKGVYGFFNYGPHTEFKHKSDLELQLEYNQAIEEACNPPSGSSVKG